MKIVAGKLMLIHLLCMHGIVISFLLLTFPSMLYGQVSPSSDLNNIPKQYEDMQLVWHDEFDVDERPDLTNWNYEYGFVRNDELQWYQPDNAFCENGVLIIEGRKEIKVNPNYNPASDNWIINRKMAQYTSACLITKGLQEWTAGGYYEVRARIDTAKGAWPAIWLLGTGNEWPYNGEIDMMEFYRINDVPHVLANVAWATPRRYVAAWAGARKALSDFTCQDSKWAEKFHLWAMRWDEDFIRLYLDDVLMNEVHLNKAVNPDGSHPFVGDRKFYLLLNLAIGSNGGIPCDDAFPISFEIDYVRVYKTL